MPVTPATARVLVSVNAGLAQSGLVNVNFLDTVQLSGENTTGWGTQRWEIYDYPIGFAAPAGWSTDVTGVYFSTAITPPSFTLPNSSSNNNWGKFSIRLVVNNNPTKIGPDGARNASFNTALTDEKTILNLRSVDGLEGLGFGESTQGDTLRSWAGTIMRALRTLVSLVGTYTNALFTWKPVSSTSFQRNFAGMFTTTDATPTIMFDLSLDVSSSAHIIYHIEVRDTATGKAKFLWFDDHWKRVGGGAPARVGTAVAPRDLDGGSSGASDAAFPAIASTVTTTGSVVRLTGTGVVATNLQWFVTAQAFITE